METFSLTPDGRWVVYDLFKPGIWRISTDGGTPTKVSDAGAEKAQVSPDGKFVAYRLFDRHIGRPQIVVLTLDGGAPVKTLDLPAPTPDTVIRWATDSRALVYTHTQGGAANLWRLPLDGGRPVQITNFTSDNIRYFAYSRDGRQLALSRGNTTRDAVLISDEK